jgi:hypothetical protein
LFFAYLFCVFIYNGTPALYFPPRVEKSPLVFFSPNKLARPVGLGSPPIFAAQVVVGFVFAVHPTYIDMLHDDQKWGLF